MAKTDKTPLGEVIINEARLSFAYLFEPQEGMENDDGTKGEPKYGCRLLVPKGAAANELAVKLKAVNDEVKKAQWGSNIPKLKAEKIYWRDGDLEDYEGYAGMYYIACSNPDQPVLVDRLKDEKDNWEVLTKENGGPKKLYSGAFVRAIIRVWAQDNKWGKRLNASLESVQFLRKGEPFSGRAPVDPNAKFDDLPDDLDDEDEDDAASML